jgi:hypothetical protein
MPAGSTQSTLESMREIQAWGASYSPAEPSPGATAPDYCLAASRFVVGKLVGLFPPDHHLNDFLRSRAASPKALHTDAVGAKFAWGRLSTTDKRPDLAPAKQFNESVLPAAITWGRADMTTDDTAPAPGDVKFVSVTGNAAAGDHLLQQHVPLVVAVSLHGTGSRDHFIAMVMDRADALWAIDSWGNWKEGSVVKLRPGTTLAAGLTVAMNASPATRIPCAKPFVGWYETKHDGAPLTLKVAL